MKPMTIICRKKRFWMPLALFIVLSLYSGAFLLSGELIPQRPEYQVFVNGKRSVSARVFQAKDGTYLLRMQDGIGARLYPRLLCIYCAPPHVLESGYPGNHHDIGSFLLEERRDLRSGVRLGDAKTEKEDPKLRFRDGAIEFDYNEIEGARYHIELRKQE
jgi:hypothetical protein